MSITWHFQPTGESETQLGVVIAGPRPSHRDFSPPSVVGGLFRDTARVVTVGRNLVYGLSATLYVKAADPVAFAQAIDTIQQLAGKPGVVRVKVDTVTKIASTGTWYLGAIPEPPVGQGIASRFTDQLEVSAIGSGPLSFS